MLQKRAVKQICGLKKRDSNSKWFEKLRVMKSEDLIKIKRVSICSRQIVVVCQKMYKICLIKAAKYIIIILEIKTISM